MPVFDIEPGANPKAYGTMRFGLEGGNESACLFDSDGNASFAGALTLPQGSLSTMDAPVDSALRTWNTQIANPSVNASAFFYGHSVIAGTGASNAWLQMPRQFKTAAEDLCPGTVVTISGNAGFTSAQLLSAAPPAAFTSLSAGSVGLLVYMGLLNDCTAGTDPATSQANIEATIDAFRGNAAAATNMSVLILVEWKRTTASGGYAWSRYVQAAYAAAASRNAAVLDLGSRLGDAATALPSIWTDGTHLNDAGQRLVAEMITGVVFRTPSIVSMFPTSAFIAPMQYPAANTSWPIANLNSVTGTNLYGNWVLKSSATGSTGSNISYNVALRAGIYAITVHYQKTTDCGIGYVYIDGVQQAGSVMDAYAASVAYSNTTVSNYSIKTSGYHTIMLQVDGKNASATDYRFGHGGIWITRVSDITT